VGHILVTGATGWLGKSSINFLLNNNFAIKNIIAAASSNKSMDLGKLTAIPVEDFFNLNPSEEIDGIIHLAFLTREKVDSLTFENYVKINNQITSKAVNLVKTVKPKWVVNVSSGAVFNSKNKELEQSLKNNPYGFLKLIEENELKVAAHAVGANLIIGRLWGASGTFMQLNRAYALSDFIFQAYTEKKIIVNSNKTVLRRYVDSEVFMGALIECALMGRDLVIDSGGPLVEIGELASVVGEAFGVEEILRPKILSTKADDYYPRGEQFKAIADEFNLPITDIRQQVASTIAGHLKLM
jgi:nucleoside-diphosphate-sugar epimerase